jgi:hypothetical protein
MWLDQADERRTSMKKIDVLAVAAGVITLIGGLPALAQDNTFNFHVSSSFYAGSAKMPPGNYTLRQISDEPQAFTLQNSSGSHSVILEARQSSKASKGKPEILFNRYGTTEDLEGIETSTGNSVDLSPGFAEKLAAKNATPQPHTVSTM